MKDIERLFGDDRPVPGIRPSGRTTVTSFVPDIESSPKAVDELEASNLGEIEAPVAQKEERGARPPGPRFPLTVVEPVRVLPGRQLLSAHDRAHPHSERVRLLRTELLLRHPATEGAAAIAVVGATVGEGRSQLAAELALTFAQLDRSTLLLDADLRNPRQHLLFGAELRDGLAQAIVRGEPPPFFGVEGYPTMSLVTAGLSESNPLELLSDGRFQSLIDDLRRSFEFIIVDTPRCSDYADGVVAAAVVGHVLTVHRAGHTPYKAARAMFRQLASAQVDILGSVLNHF